VFLLAREEGRRVLARAAWSSSRAGKGRVPALGPSTAWARVVFQSAGRNEVERWFWSEVDMVGLI
jgi:hypothetical protein